VGSNLFSLDLCLYKSLLLIGIRNWINYTKIKGFNWYFYLLILFKFYMCAQTYLIWICVYINHSFLTALGIGSITQKNQRFYSFYDKPYRKILLEFSTLTLKISKHLLTYLVIVWNFELKINFWDIYRNQKFMRTSFCTPHESSSIFWNQTTPASV
jgi:hypothetical protein